MTKRILAFFISFTVPLLLVFGQHTHVPNKPNEVRVLPESFKEDYTGNDYNYEESVSLITKFKIWLIEKLRDLFSTNIQNVSETVTWIKYAFYFVVIALAIYILVKMILGKEGRWLFKRNQKENTDLEYDIDEDIQSVNFEALIEKAVSENDYRLAIKYHYFYLLKKLDDNHIIKYDPQKTTYDYQLDLEGTKHNSVFSKAAYYYTYIWYGEFSIDATEYETTSHAFTELLNSVTNE